MLKVSCSVASALPQLPPAFVIRAIALLTHIRKALCTLMQRANYRVTTFIYCPDPERSSKQHLFVLNEVSPREQLLFISPFRLRSYLPFLHSRTDFQPVINPL